MKFFIDTANIEQIKTAAAWGVLDGVTTNPSLVAKEQGDYVQLLKEIVQIVDGSISAEVVAEDIDGMIEEAKFLASLHENIVIKVPFTPDGLKVTKILSDEGIGVNETLIFSPLQALMAAKAGAKFVSPFVGRLDDISHQGMELVGEIVTIFDNYAFETEVLVASVRHPLHVLEAALMGADVATIPFAVLEKMFKHPLTDIGIKRFLDDWKKAGKKM
ncbi:fructose-6-phosphate aldolase [bacterium]|nr:fructose-6-phosphate aldolase [bacterium]